MPTDSSNDLADNLLVRAALIELGSGSTQAKSQGRLRRFLECFGDYQKRTGFVDAYGGTLDRLLNKPLSRLGDDAGRRSPAAIDDWRDPTVRHRLLAIAGRSEPLLRRFLKGPRL